jgi:NitT/TauT family transport system permease protein
MVAGGIVIPRVWRQRARRPRIACQQAFRPWFARFWPPALGMLLLVVLWEAAVFAFKLPNFVLPLPQEIAEVAAEHMSDLWHNAQTTLFEAVVGFTIGAALGFVIAMAMVVWIPVERAVLPLFVTVNSVPMAAFGPLLTIWFGIGVAAKIILVVVVVSYAVLLNTLAGLRSCDPGAIALLRSFGANDLQIMGKLRLPGALPSIFSGLKVAVVHSMILAIVLEMLGAYSGLGWSIYQATQMMNFVEAWAAVTLAIIMSLIIYGLVALGSRRAIWWPQGRELPG